MDSVNHEGNLRVCQERRPKADSPLVLRATGIRKVFGGEVVLDNVHVELRAGEVVLLRGENGCGKTTLLNILTGNLSPEAGNVELLNNGTKEHFVFPMPWWRWTNPFEHFAPERLCREGVGRSWQEVRLFATQTLRENIAVATPGQIGENLVWALLHRRRVAEQDTKVLAAADIALGELGLRGREASSADRVSLGQAKRVAIARAVQAGARILFLDEPLAGLDSRGIADVMELLERLVQHDGLTLVIVEHAVNIPRLSRLLTTVWTLANGQASTERLAPERNDAVRLECENLPEWVTSVFDPKGERSRRDLSRGAIIFRLTSGTAPDDVSVLEVEDLVVYRGRRLVIGQKEDGCSVRGLSLVVRQGEVAVLQAANGWGKTTLLEAIAGIVPIAQGTIRLDGQPIHHMPPWKRARLGISLLQARNHTFGSLTVRETLRLAGIRDIPAMVARWVDRHVCDLSGGEKQKLAMVCAQERDSRLLLLDEPFSALDAEGLESLRRGLLGRSCPALVAIPSTLEGGTQV